MEERKVYKQYIRTDRVQRGGKKLRKYILECLVCGRESVGRCIVSDDIYKKCIRCKSDPNYEDPYTPQGEVWKEVVGYDGLYWASNFGRIKNKRDLLTQFDHNQGYLFVHLHRESKMQNILSHRVIALTFLPNPENKGFVNHKDGNKKNNHVSNLEWVTKSENVIHAYKYLGIVMPSLTKERSAVGKRVVRTDLEGNKFYYPTLTEATKDGFPDIKSICAACKGYIKQYKGNIWQYISKEEYSQALLEI